MPKSLISFILVALASLLTACAQLDGPKPQPSWSPAQPSQQELDLREYQMLQSSVLNQVSAIDRASNLAWYAVHEVGGIRHHADCHRVPASLMRSPLYDQFAYLMTMVYRGRCVTEVTAVLAKGAPPKPVKK